jgi:hypothetical protein
MEKETIKVGKTTYKVSEIEKDVKLAMDKDRGWSLMFTTNTVEGLCQRIRELEAMIEDQRIPTIKDKAKRAIFYVDEFSIWFRMNACMEDSFLCENEDNGDVHEIQYSEVSDTCEFYALTNITK